MALSLFSSSPLHNTLRSTILPLSSCRWNSTTRSGPPPIGTGMSTGRSTSRFRITPNRQKFYEDQKAQQEGRILEKYQTREWKAGDIYAPHDLSPTEMKKWKRRFSPSTDAFDALNINPLDLYKNFSIMSEYVTTMGRIKHRSQTGLRPVNQRKLAKAIRRAIGLGLMPSVHKHPEILALESKSKPEGLI
ncbi:hypothetical protein PHISCL_01707 [Aspergillus sclerotialis]|uniref:Small ribosomal subunit protein bS18m n=1 Tax=Aspergillus sclerotialis TaxID=2070753 RepID=A0A3A2ZS20_9EURO|nr:hypothetical protein PHISCL_01707 [Aspergillus sclerotialis]